MARKRFSSGKFNTSLMLDTAIASLLVQKAPAILNKFLFSGNPVTGTTATLVGVGASYLYGMLMKNNNVSNIGIALGVVEVVTPMIDQLLGQVIGGTDQVLVTPSGTLVTNSKYLPAVKNTVGISDYGTLSGNGFFNLSEYMSSPVVQHNDVYRNSY